MTEMKAQDIVYIMQTKENIEWNIENAQNVHARYRMEQALHYIDGALKAVEIGKDEKAWFAVDKASYWMQQARAVCREDGESEGRKTPKNPSLPHRERCSLMTYFRLCFRYIYTQHQANLFSKRMGAGNGLKDTEKTVPKKRWMQLIQTFRQKQNV